MEPIVTEAYQYGVQWIQARIGYLVGEHGLRATKRRGKVYLTDGRNPRVELVDRTQSGIDHTLYDWAVYTGLTNEDFEDFTA